MALDAPLIASASTYGIALTAYADPATGDADITVYTPDGGTLKFTDEAAAESAIRAEITAVDNAAADAADIAARWTDINADAAAERDAWNTMAEEVESALPDGCTMPRVFGNSPYGANTYGTMAAEAAAALAEWKTAARDSAARRRLRDALEAEGAELRIESAERIAPGGIRHRLDYWESEATLWRRIDLVGVKDGADIRNGRVEVMRATVRHIAVRMYGIAVASSQEQIDVAVDSLEAARAAVASAAEKHRQAADRLARNMRL